MAFRSIFGMLAISYLCDTFTPFPTLCAGSLSWAPSRDGSPADGETHLGNARLLERDPVSANGGRLFAPHPATPRTWTRHSDAGMQRIWMQLFRARRPTASGVCGGLVACVPWQQHRGTLCQSGTRMLPSIQTLTGGSAGAGPTSPASKLHRARDREHRPRRQCGHLAFIWRQY